MNKDIKKFIKSILLFIPFSVLIYFVLIIIVCHIPYQFLKPNINYRIGSYGHMYSRIKEIKNYKNIDILFLGSSQAYRGFDVRVYNNAGFKVFNLGSSNQTPIQTNVLLKRYLDLLNPKLVIFEVSPETFSTDGVESSVDLIANDKNDFLTITDLIQYNNIKTLNTAICGFYKDFTGENNDFVENPKKDDDLYIKGGFVEKQLKFNKPKKHKNINFEYNSKQILAFENCLKLIHKKKIKLILLQTPITKSLYKSYLNKNQFDSLMSRYGEYYNFNKILNLNDSLDFYDPYHLNKNGTTIFNKKLIKMLIPNINLNNL